MIQCMKCREEKPVTAYDFHEHDDRYPEKAEKAGKLKKWCRSCCNEASERTIARLKEESRRSVETRIPRTVDDLALEYLLAEDHEDLARRCLSLTKQVADLERQLTKLRLEKWGRVAKERLAQFEREKAANGELN